MSTLRPADPDVFLHDLLLQLLFQDLSGLGRYLEALLFSSKARNEARPDSDSDVVVILDRLSAGFLFRFKSTPTHVQPRVAYLGLRVATYR